MMEGCNELRLNRVAQRKAARPMRHALASFLTALEFDPDLRDDIVTAVGEVVANALEHAYDETSFGNIELYVRVGDDDTVAVDVLDHGQFIERDRQPGRGFGLGIVRAIARTVAIDTGDGTRVRMIFAKSRGEVSAT